MPLPYVLWKKLAVVVITLFFLSSTFVIFFLRRKEIPTFLGKRLFLTFEESELFWFSKLTQASI